MKDGSKETDCQTGPSTGQCSRYGQQRHCNPDPGRGQRHAAEVQPGEGAARGRRARAGVARGAFVRAVGREENHRGDRPPSREGGGDFAPYGVETVVQQPQNGTGHALLVAKREIGNAKYVVVLPGDARLVRTETLRALINKHKKGAAAATILTAVLADPSGYGRIL